MSRLDRLLVCEVVAVALVFGWSGLTSGYEGPYDEGNTLCAATRVLAGEIPGTGDLLDPAPAGHDAAPRRRVPRSARRSRSNAP